VIAAASISSGTTVFDENPNLFSREATAPG
jgi:hypothetical protein